MSKVFEKFLAVVTEAEKRFDQHLKRMQEMNRLIFEYENLSVSTYQNMYDIIGHSTYQPTENTNNDTLLLFNAQENQELKSEFDKLVFVSNPFSNMKLWLKFQLYEIESLFECMERRKQLQKIYEQAMDQAQSSLEELSKLERGEMTMATWWKSKATI